MQWFYTPEEYMLQYEPRRVRKDTHPGEGSRCPKCGNGDPKKLERLTNQWHCKRIRCSHAWPVTYYETVIEQSPAEYLRDRIETTYNDVGQRLRAGDYSDGFTKQNGIGVLGTIAKAGMMSDDPKFARDSMVMTAQKLYEQHQRQEAFKRELARFEREHQHALRLADIYLGGPQVRSAAAQAAQDAHAERLGEAIADSMMRRVADQQQHGGG